MVTRDETMSIKREDLDAGRIDFGDVATGKRLALIHPGEILRDDFLAPMKISVYTLAHAIKVPRSRVNDIVLGRRGITADSAFRLAAILAPRRHFGSISRPATTWTPQIESFAAASNGKSRPAPPEANGL